MQLAILLVLIVIAVILAPWLLGLIAVGIAAYGLWLIISLAVAAVFTILVVGVILMSGSKRSMSSKTEQIISEVNEQYREKEAAERAAARAASTKRS